MASGIAVGQRYVSDAEPELGLGLVIGVDGRMVELAFAAADEVRRYVVGSSPLRRVRFSVGDVLVDEAGLAHPVDGVEERDELLFYRSGEVELPETRVAARTDVSGPRERLLSGRVDAPAAFDLRVETLERLHAIRASPVRGFAGPRIELLPHQFSVAGDVSARLLPRVLLADETGLGKTIEAGLIISRLILTGRAARVLVIVPDALVNQWLVELRRRFQLRFAVFDAERCDAIEESEPGTNPFVQDQFVLAGLSLFSGNEERSSQAADARWDVVVVDEAHHLQWSRQSGPGAGYAAVERIAQGSEGLLLLTATPEQLGAEGHFARLRLLDPDRYGDFEQWREEAEGWRDAARIAGELSAQGPPSAGTAADLAGILGRDLDEIRTAALTEQGRCRLLSELIDRHGPGRVMFRNTRAAVAGFPRRSVHRHQLQAPADALQRDALLARLASELSADVPDPRSRPEVSFDFNADPRIAWLVGLLGADGPAKVLVLCSSAAKVEALEAAIAARIRIATAQFHEGLTLLQRDRGAAWFAEPDGARLMICSELGSEGRNFQHAQHLVLFDLPLDPDVLEQRIGRLDRIGQRGTVEIHVPWVAGSGQQVLVRWLDEGIDALRRPTLAARPLLERFGNRVRELATSPIAADCTEQLDRLVADTAEAAKELAEHVEKGRDRLLEMASLRREIADPLIAAVRALDEDEALEDFFLRILEHFHVPAEEAWPRCYLLNPDGTRSPDFPSLESSQTMLSFDRHTALVREDLAFATADHPLLCDAMEFLVASPGGNASFALLEDAQPARLWLEALFVVEPVAPARLHCDRFLAPVPVRIVLDQHLREAVATDDPSQFDLVSGRGQWVATNQATLAPLLAKMSVRCKELAEERAALLRRDARAAASAQLGAELERLASLAAVNAAVRPEEADALRAQREELDAALAGARLRADSLRLVWQGPVSGGDPKFRA